MSLSSMSAGHMSEGGQINGGSGPNSSVELGKSWQMHKATVQPKPVLGSGAGFQKNTDKEEASATSGNPIA